MKLSEAISKRIIMLCREKNISVEQLTRQVRADPQVVMAIVNGYGNTAPLDVMGEICLVLGITMTAFFIIVYLKVSEKSFSLSYLPV